MNHVFNGVLHEDRGVVEQRDLGARRTDPLNVGNGLFDAIDDIQRRRRAILHHDQNNRLLTLHQNGVELGWSGELHICDISQIDILIADTFDRQTVEVLHR